MKRICLIIYFLLISSCFAQSTEIKALNQKMTEIRRNTNWDDRAAAQRANEEIKRISKQIQLLKQNINSADPDKTDEIKKQNVEQNTKIFSRIADAAGQGVNADVLIGTPIRDEIIEEYINDESPIIKNSDYLNDMDLLVIDMSLKTVQRTIDQMENFKSIKTLVIICSRSPSTVDLQAIIKKAKNYPLENLYISNFQNYVTSLPKQIGNFAGLKVLSVVNNKIRSLPSEINKLTSLKSLYMDINPLSAISQNISRLRNLEKLGIGKTNIAGSELSKIKQLLPNCEIITQ